MAYTQEQQAQGLIAKANHILIITREHATLDAVCAVVAVGLLLKKLQKNFDAVVPAYDPTGLPGFLKMGVDFQPKVGAIRAFHLNINTSRAPLANLSYGVKDGQLDVTIVPKHGEWTPADLTFRAGADRYDLIITVACPDRASLGDLAREHADFLFRVPVINLDCGAANENWGQINLLDINAVSTTETIYNWLAGWDHNQIDGQLATAILAGMIAATKAFRTANVTPRALESAAKLVTLGGDRQRVVRELWRTRSLATLKLWGRTMSRLEQDHELGLVWATLTTADFVETGAAREDLDGIVEELLSYAPEAKVVALIYPEHDRLIVSLHADTPQSAADLARLFGATGTRERAVFPLTETNDLVAGTQAVIARLRARLKPLA